MHRAAAELRDRRRVAAQAGVQVVVEHAAQPGRINIRDQCVLMTIASGLPERSTKSSSVSVCARWRPVSTMIQPAGAAKITLLPSGCCPGANTPRMKCTPGAISSDGGVSAKAAAAISTIPAASDI
jgi:hypothetical protein